VYIYGYECSDTVLPSGGTFWKMTRYKNKKTIAIIGRERDGEELGRQSDAGMLFCLYLCLVSISDQISFLKRWRICIHFSQGESESKVRAYLG